VKLVLFLVAVACIVLGFLTAIFAWQTHLSPLAWFVAAIAIAMVFRGGPE
jgi:hypothetical protein